VVTSAEGAVARVGEPGTLLGVFPSVKLSNAVVELAPGDTLVLFTDGVTEAHGADGLFGDRRLQAVLQSLAGAPADEVAAGLADAVVGHRAGGSSDDDMAVLVVRVEPRG
jgi:sigma-B regulation protein RsbU (phosphoserine phosphatase)